VFTDGMPNCLPDPMATGIPTVVEKQHAADWLNKNVLTFVVGLPGANGVTLLNDVAVNGGTMQYLTPDDPVMLGEKLKEVIQQQISMGFDSCAIDLMPVASAPDKPQLSSSRPGAMPWRPSRSRRHGGWTANADGSHVELSGDICDAASGSLWQDQLRPGPISAPNGQARINLGSTWRSGRQVPLTWR
jgi:hypothetical protein